MKSLKFGIIVFAIVGLAGMFLPFLGSGSDSVSLWDFRKIGGASGQVYLSLVTFAIPLVLGLVAIVRGSLARWQAIVATISFGLAVVKMRQNMDLAIGAKLMLIAAAAGLLVALLSSIKPENRLTA